MLLTVLMAAMSIASMQAEKVAQAIWTAGNTTLTFIYDETVYNEGDTFNGETVTNVWSGEKLSQQYTMGLYGYFTNDNWNEEVRGNMTTAVFDESFKDFAPTNTSYWFNSCSKMTIIEGLEYLNSKDVTSMDHMFYHCSGLTSLDVSHFDTGNVTGKGGSYWGTYYNFVASMTVPEGVEAYTTYVDGDTLALARIEGGIIPKGNAVVLKSAKAEVVLDVNTTPRSLIEGNALAGVDVDTALPENGYALAAVDDMAGLWRTADEGAQVKGHEGYLPYAGDDTAGYPFPGENDETVGIEAVHGSLSSVHGSVYNLQGQRVQGKANAHGLYVVDGKKLYVR